MAGKPNSLRAWRIRRRRRRRRSSGKKTTRGRGQNSQKENLTRRRKRRKSPRWDCHQAILLCMRICVFVSSTLLESFVTSKHFVFDTMQIVLEMRCLYFVVWPENYQHFLAVHDYKKISNSAWRHACIPQGIPGRTGFSALLWTWKYQNSAGQCSTLGRDVKKLIKVLF